MIQTLMSVDGDGKGDFVKWLKELGLSDRFLRDYITHLQISLNELAA